MPRKLRVEYRSEDAFRNEYAQNISKGGIFIPTRHQIEIRETVEIELVLTFRDQSVVLPGEVVHCIPPEMAETGAQPGVAIQFLMAGDELRGKLEPYAGVPRPSLDERAQGTGRRVAPRFRARVPVRVEADGEWTLGHTRNISPSGVLVALPENTLPVGKNVNLCLQHPSDEEEMQIRGLVARHLEASGAMCVAIEFRVPEARRYEVAEFVSRVRTVEHARRLGGINGPIADLGIRSVLTMFGSSAPEGMLTLSCGSEEGYITIHSGQLRAQLGNAIGREALDALLAWTEGSFEFEPLADEGLVNGPEIPVAEIAEGDCSPPPVGARPEPALELPEERASGGGLRPTDLDDFDLEGEPAEAAGGMRVDASPISPDRILRQTGQGDRSHLSKTEEAILDLAAVGMSVAKVVDIIPEPDEEIYAAVRSLLDEELVTLE